MKNIKLLFTLVLMTITVLATSCSDWLDDTAPDMQFLNQP